MRFTLEGNLIPLCPQQNNPNRPYTNGLGKLPTEGRDGGNFCIQRASSGQYLPLEQSGRIGGINGLTCNLLREQDR